MNHKEVIAKRHGKRYREPWMNTYECVAWAKKFVTERWRYPLNRFGDLGAYSGWLNNNNTYDLRYYDRIPNTKDNVPVEGDIIHFKPVSGNKYGHVAVVNKATVNMIEVEEQNAKGGQQGLWADAITNGASNYSNVLGWYHAKANTPVVPPTIDEDIQLLIDDNIFNWIYEPMSWERMIKIVAKAYKKLKQ